MNGPQHYAEAERITEHVVEVRRQLDGQVASVSRIEASDRQVAELIQLAQVHAALALVAVTVESQALSAEEMLAWRWAGAVNDADRDRP